MLICALFVFSTILVQVSRCLPQTSDLCNPSPCGVNTKCRVDQGRAICSCLATYVGNPIQGCKRECEVDSNCARHLGCVNYKCRDPCVGACADHAICQVVNQKADCKCPPDYNGDGYSVCVPECTSHEHCPANRACIGHKCGDPCQGTGKKSICGTNAECRVNTETHKAICRCPTGWSGHPIQACIPPGR